MAMPATQIRRGMVLVFEGQPCRVIEFRHHTPGNLRAMVQVKLRSLKNGNQFEHAQWMQPGMKIIAEYFDGKAIGIELPQHLSLTITDTAPVMKTATKTASTKPAVLENGVTIQVPEFIAQGERVRVNPSTGDYMDRAKD